MGDKIRLSYAGLAELSRSPVSSTTTAPGTHDLNTSLLSHSVSRRTFLAGTTSVTVGSAIAPAIAVADVTGYKTLKINLSGDSLQLTTDRGQSVLSLDLASYSDLAGGQPAFKIDPAPGDIGDTTTEVSVTVLNAAYRDLVIVDIDGNPQKVPADLHYEFKKNAAGFWMVRVSSTHLNTTGTDYTDLRDWLDPTSPVKLKQRVGTTRALLNLSHAPDRQLVVYRNARIDVDRKSGFPVFSGNKAGKLEFRGRGRVNYTTLEHISMSLTTIRTFDQPDVTEAIEVAGLGGNASTPMTLFALSPAGATGLGIDDNRFLPYGADIDFERGGLLFARHVGLFAGQQDNVFHAFLFGAADLVDPTESKFRPARRLYSRKFVPYTAPLSYAAVLHRYSGFAWHESSLLARWGTDPGQQVFQTEELQVFPQPETANGESNGPAPLNFTQSRSVAGGEENPDIKLRCDIGRLKIPLALPFGKDTVAEAYVPDGGHLEFHWGDEESWPEYPEPTPNPDGSVPPRNAFIWLRPNGAEPHWLFPRLAVRVLQPHNLISLDFELRDFLLSPRSRRENPSGYRLFPRHDGSGDNRSRVLVTFGPQHIAEKALGMEELGSGPVSIPRRGQYADRSRLAFTVYDHVKKNGIGLDLQSFLDWSGWQQTVVDVAKTDFLLGPHERTECEAKQKHDSSTTVYDPEKWKDDVEACEAGSSEPVPRQRGVGVAPPLLLSGPSPAPTVKVFDAAWSEGWDNGRDVAPPRGDDTAEPRAPKATETSIELPWNLKLSPHKWARWEHQSTFPEIDENGDTVRAEVWHSSMASWEAVKVTQLYPAIQLGASTYDAEERSIVLTKPQWRNQEAAWRNALADMAPEKPGQPGERRKPSQEHVEFVGRQDLDTVRAVYSDDFQPGEHSAGDPVCDFDRNVGPDFDILPSKADRSQIVNLSSNFSLQAVTSFNDINCLAAGGVSEACTAPGTIPVKIDYQPNGIQTNRLMLSTVGGSALLHGRFNPSFVYGKDGSGRPFTIDQWDQDTKWGRDEYVLVSKRGYILPFGHQVSLVVTVEREFVDGRSEFGKGKTGIPRKRYYCQLRQEGLEYPLPEPGTALEGRRFCFNRIELQPLYTPALNRPVDILSGAPTDDPAAFWMIPEGTEEVFSHKILGVDRQDKPLDFQLPLLWVSRQYAEYEENNQQTLQCSTPTTLAAILSKYHGEFADRRTADIQGVKVAYTPEQADEKPTQAKRDDGRDGRIETSKITFAVATLNRNGPTNAGDVSGTPEYAPDKLLNLRPQILKWPAVQYYPIVQMADVHLQAVTQFSGRATDTARIRYNRNYHYVGFFKSTAGSSAVEIDLGNGQKETAVNTGQLFSDVWGPRLDFPGGKSGGLATPNLNIAHIGRLMGPVGGKALSNPPDSNLIAGITTLATDTDVSISAGKFEPSEIFASLIQSAKLLGAVELAEVIETIHDVEQELERVPKLIEEELSDFRAAVETIKDIKETYVDQVEEIIATVRFARDLTETVKQIEVNGKAVRKDLAAFFEDYIDYLIGAHFKRELEIVEGTLELKLKEELPQRERELKKIAEKLLEEWCHDTEACKDILEIEEGWSNAVAVARQIEQDVLQARDSLDEYAKYQKQNLYAYREVLVVQAKKEIEAQLNGMSTELKDRVYSYVRENLDPEPFIAEARSVRNQMVEAVDSFKEFPLAEVRKHFDNLRELVELMKDPKNLLGEGVRVLNEIRDDLTEAVKTEAEARQKELAMELEAQAKHKLKELENRAKPIIAKASNDIKKAADEKWNSIKGDLERQFSASEIQTLVNYVEEGYQAYQTFLTLRLVIDKHIREFDLGDARDEAVRLINPRAMKLQIVGALLDQPEIKNVVDLATEAEEIYKFIKNNPNETIEFLFRQGATITGRPLGEAHEIYLYYLDLSAAMSEGVRQYRDWQLDKQRDRLERAILQNPLVSSALETANAAYADALEVIGGILIKVDEIANLIPKEINLAYDWNPRLKSGGPGGKPIFLAERQGIPTDFVIKAEIRKSLGWDASKLKLDTDTLTQAPKILVDARMRDFTLNLVPPSNFFILEFSELGMRSENGSKPDVDVKLEDVKLGQALEFVQKLQSILNPGSGLFIDPSSSGILAGYSFALPALTTGGFNLYQLSINTGIILPFDGSEVTARCSVSTRSRPFLLTVGILGGGGFLGINVSARGVDLLEGAMEYGAIAGFEVGPAKGIAKIVGGFYFSVARDQAVMTGYLNAAGALDVAGLITVSVGFYLGLSYVRRGDQSYAIGEATVYVSVEYTFFEITFTLRCVKEYAGSKRQKDKARLWTTMLPFDEDDAGLCGDGESGREVFTKDEWHEFREQYVW